MILNEKIKRIQKLMLLENSQEHDLGVFKKFDLNKFKSLPPPADNSQKTKNELKFLKTIDLNKRFVQEKDDIYGNFVEFLKEKNIKFPKEKLESIHYDVSKVVRELKMFYKRPRPFRLDDDMNDILLKSMTGFAYPSGHSTQSYLLCHILSDMYPKFKSDFEKIAKDIVYSRQMAKAHYPSDISFGKKLAKELFNFLKNQDVI
jgi:hypothetical protein